MLTPQVIQTIFKQRKLLQEVKVDDKTFQVGNKFFSSLAQWSLNVIDFSLAKNIILSRNTPTIRISPNLPPSIEVLNSIKFEKKVFRHF